MLPQHIMLREQQALRSPTFLTFRIYLKSEVPFNQYIIIIDRILFVRKKSAWGPKMTLPMDPNIWQTSTTNVNIHLNYRNKVPSLEKSIHIFENSQLTSKNFPKSPMIMTTEPKLDQPNLPLLVTRHHIFGLSVNI